MNDALELYQNCDEVISVHGWMYPVNSSDYSSFFLEVLTVGGGLHGKEVGVYLMRTENHY